MQSPRNKRGETRGSRLGVIGSSESAAILRVLLVEPDGRDGQRLLDALQGGGHVVHARQLCRQDELVRALREEPWDAALLSCSLDDLPVAAAMALFRQLAPKLPVILTVERGSPDFPFELLDNGACDFVFKSNPSRLLAVVERECARAGLLQETQESLANPESFGQIDEGAARFFQLASHVPECYWLADAKTQRITYVSKGYEQIWGRHVEALYAHRLDWLNYVHRDDRERVLAEARRHRMGGLDIRFRVERPGDSLRWLHVRNFPVHGEAGEIVSVGGVATDITCLLADKGKAPFFAHFDALTALPNQLMFHDQMQRMIALSRRKQLSLGVMVVDIDRFHELNQTFGHASGDELLRQIAGRVSGSLRESDVLGRIGGDVFGVLLPDVGDIQQAGIVARRIIDALIMPVRVDGCDVFATAGIGIVFYPQDGRDVHQLVSNAEIACRHAKSAGRNNYHCYSPGMQENIRDRMLLEIDLRNATLRKEFVLHFQPKASCANGRVTGTEALLRWAHPRRGVVGPDQFIPLLEETGLIVQVGRWVLEEACRQTVEWQAAGLDIPSISVNLSARQLQSDTLLADVAATLGKTGLKPACLDLEITESMLMHNAETAIGTLTALKKMGVTISLDDFGTGYSSLAYLKRFPIDTVKVDRSFVQDIAADSDDASITRAVITMAHHLKLKVVAEGVETQEQLALLISHQCDVIQGYFFSRPLTAPAMMDLLSADKRLPTSLLRSGTRKPMALFVAVEGFETVISRLVREGHRVCEVADIQGAMQWFTGNLVDVLVCGAPRKDFDAAALIGQAAQTQPKCERILVADTRQWNRKAVAALSASGQVHRVIHAPADAETFYRVVEEALGRRYISDEYSRLSHEVEVAEREMLRIDEERQRLASENQMLRDQAQGGYQILQDVLAEVPWPVIGIDEAGLVALANDAACARFAARGFAPGIALAAVLPEVGAGGTAVRVELDGVKYRCRWRTSSMGGGRVLLLEEENE
jgi:diguanylate cyclase (GGDEF)-like protein